jgi:hypothetical protein
LFIVLFGKFSQLLNTECRNIISVLQMIKVAELFYNGNSFLVVTGIALVRGSSVREGFNDDVNHYVVIKTH